MSTFRRRIGDFLEFRRSIRGASFEEVFYLWKQRRVAEEHQACPRRTPYPLEHHDGCTFGPELCRPCCFEHDLAYWYSSTPRARKRADDALYSCIRETSLHDEWHNGWFWAAWAWAFWLAVRVGGKRHINGGKQ